MVAPSQFRRDLGIAGLIAGLLPTPPTEHRPFNEVPKPAPLVSVS